MAARPRKKASAPKKNPRPALPEFQGPIVLVPEALALCGYKSAVSLWSLEKQGLFPKRIRLGPKRVGWHRRDIESWRESRASGIGAEVVKVDAQVAEGGR